MGMELPGNPIPKPQDAEQSIAASPAHQGAAAGGKPRFPRAGKSPKQLKSSNSDSRGWLSLGDKKEGAQAGMGMSPEHCWHPPGP